MRHLANQSTEIEAKLLVPRETDRRAIARLARLGAYRLRSRGTARLHSLYLDTGEMALARRGVALRLRRHGRRWEATAKWAGRVDGALHERPELTVALSAAPRWPFSLPDGPLRTRLCRLLAGRALAPILVTDIQRRLFDVLPAASSDGDLPIAELALDRVRLAAPSRGHSALATYGEVEIELRHGSRRDVTRLAHLLQRRFGLVASSDSKFARGLALLYGPEQLRPFARPRRAARSSRSTPGAA